MIAVDNADIVSLALIALAIGVIVGMLSMVLISSRKD